MPSPIIGHGSVFNLIAGSTSTPIAGVQSVDFGSDKVDTLDVTNMGTSGFTRAFIGGLRNPGDCSLKLLHLPTDASQAALIAAEDGTVHNFSFVETGAVGTITFSGIIESVDMSAPDDKVSTMSVKIKITGAFAIV